ncbi:MAG: anti-sigma factor [Agarilytica sp.]
MSGNANGDEPLGGQPQEEKTLAFEYVTGVLSADEKHDFRARLDTDPQLQKEVRFWEQQLMSVHPEEARAPQANAWNKISDAIAPQPRHQTTQTSPGFDWKALFQWGSPTIAAVALMFVLFGYYPNATNTPSTPTSADYVAVLTDTEGRALLTALSAAHEKSMQLKWETLERTPNTNMQLWAISKRDGEARPITVFTDTSVDQLTLNTAQWRLVTDADFLLLTEEEPGGSAIDEPSEHLLAKGVCVRFSPDKSAS